MIRCILPDWMTGRKLLVLGTLVAGLALVGGTVALALEFTVTSTTDAVDARPGDGVCATSTGPCTLRAAIQEANARSGPDTIVLQPGIYTLAIDGVDENTGRTGDLDVTDALTIKGMGMRNTRIDGNTLDRVFDIRVDETTAVHIEGVTITGGDVFEEGGGIRAFTGTLTIANSSITGNVSGGGGGGIMTDVGTVKIVDSSITRNTSSDGGGIYNGRGTIILIRTTFKNNKPDDCFTCQ